MIPEDTIQAVKTAADIVDIISERVVLKKAGRNYLGLCPFHSEKTPSFTVSPDKQIFYCFGCQTGGSVISFVMKNDGLTFPEAVKYLGGRYGIDVVDRTDRPARHSLSEKEKIYGVNQAALEFYRSSLKGRFGDRARAYLASRGFTRKTIDFHGLGYAPEQWDGLINFFRNRKVGLELLEKAGLIIARRQASGFYDRFRDRVMFPIFDNAARVVGFGGRTMGDQNPKYLNSPESPVFNKRRILYGIDKVRQAARMQGNVFVVEGYFDMLALWQVGIQNVVATLGTSLTAEHVRCLRGLVGNKGTVTLVFDSDNAGIKAAGRSVEIFTQQFMDARILVLPEGQDPDSYLRTFGPDDFMSLAQKAKASLAFIIDSAIEEFGLSVEGKVKVVEQVKEALAVIDDPVKKDLYIKQLAERLVIDQQAVAAKINTAAPAHRYRLKQGASGNHRFPKPNQNDPGYRMQRQVVAMMIRYPELVPEFVGRNLEEGVEDPNLVKVSQFIISRSKPGESIEAELVDAFQGTEMEDLVASILMDTEAWNKRDCIRLLEQFEARCRRQRQLELQKQIEDAERSNDSARLFELLKEIQLLNERTQTNLESLGG